MKYLVVLLALILGCSNAAVKNVVVKNDSINESYGPSSDKSKTYIIVKGPGGPQTPQQPIQSTPAQPPELIVQAPKRLKSATRPSNTIYQIEKINGKLVVTLKEHQ